MANARVLNIMRQGVKGWNEWRARNAVSSCDLSRTNLGGRDLQGINLVRANLTGAIFAGSDLSKAKLRHANLLHADLTYATLQGADLADADLAAASVIWTDFTRANLVRARFSMTNINRAIFEKADLANADFSTTLIGDTDLSIAKGLETVIHSGPSSIGIDTIFRSKGNIPEAFLRGAGVPDIFIEYAASLAAKPIEFYSCFISHSSKDAALAERLHADLQAKGVRCWFAPEDLKTGDKFRFKIDEAVRLHDKLLLLLSKNSVASDWVEKEVETAFEKERKEKRTVLFPIRLDRAVMKIPDGWPADIRRTRHIGDFTHWKNQDAYQKAFERLLRDLKSDKAAPPKP